jgi:hypothetical protein
MSAPEKPRPVDDRPRQEEPAPPAPADAETGPTILGFPAEPDEDDDEPATEPGERPPDATRPDVAGPPRPGAGRAPGAGRPGSAGRRGARRRPDGPAGLLMVLAGVAAAVSLALPWVRGDGATGWSRFRQGSAVLGTGIGALSRGSLWEPLAVVTAGVLLFALGLLVWVPARGHRVLGVLALLVAVLAGTGVLVPLSAADWDAGRFAAGMWAAAAVAGLGVLGAFKAMLTAPPATARPQRRPGRPPPRSAVAGR